MGRRGRDGSAAGPGALNAPFADLAKRLPRRAPAPAPPPPPPPPERDPFAAAMEGVVPLRREPDARVGAAPPAGALRRPVSEEAEALAVLSDLVEGAAR